MNVLFKRTEEIEKYPSLPAFLRNVLFLVQFMIYFVLCFASEIPLGAALKHQIAASKNAYSKIRIVIGNYLFELSLPFTPNRFAGADCNN